MRRMLADRVPCVHNGRASSLPRGSECLLFPFIREREREREPHWFARNWVWNEMDGCRMHGALCISVWPTVHPFTLPSFWSRMSLCIPLLYAAQMFPVICLCRRVLPRVTDTGYCCLVHRYNGQCFPTLLSLQSTFHSDACGTVSPHRECWNELERSTCSVGQNKFLTMVCVLF